MLKALKTFALLRAACIGVGRGEIPVVIPADYDAAVRHLQRTTSAELRSQTRPIVDASLAEVDTSATYKSLVEQHNRLPLATLIDADLTRHLLDHASDALLTLVAQKEADIRRNPAKRTTGLLRQVLG